MNRKNRIFDTNVLSGYKNKMSRSDFQKMVLSLVVFYELTATKIGERKRDCWDAQLRGFQKAKRLVIPIAADWRAASRLIWQLHQRRKNIPADATALQNDALICLSATHFSDDVPIIVTTNTKDFELIAGQINLERRNKPKLIIQSAEEYFSE